MSDAPARPDLDQLRSEAEAAVAEADGAAALEELRVRYLGRKSPLTQVLRSIGELPPEERGPTGQAGQPGAPGAGGPDRGADARTGGGRSGAAGWPRTRST